MYMVVARQLAIRILDSMWLLKDLTPSELEKRKNTLEYYLPRIKDDKERAETLLELGRIECLLGNTVQAAGRYHECLRLFRKIGDRLGIGRTLYCITLLHVERGNVEKAENVLRECMEFAKECESLWLKASCYVAKARLHFERGEYGKAVETSLKAFDMFGEIGDVDGMGRSLQNACLALMKEGKMEKTIELLESIRDTWKETSRENYVLASLQLAAMYLSLGEIEKAEKLVREAEVTSPRVSALVNMLKASINLAMGKTSKAVEHAESARETLKKLGLKADLASEILKIVKGLS